MRNGWKDARVGDFCEVISGQSPEGKSYNAAGNGTPFYQGKKDFGEKFIEAPTTWTTEPTKLARRGDILMSVRAPVGPINFATGDVCIGRGLAAIRTGKDLDTEFLFYQLRLLQPKIAGNAGAVFPSINKFEIEQIKLVAPPLPDQRRIVAILDEAFAAIATAKANTEKNLQNAHALLQSELETIFQPENRHWTVAPIGEHIRFIDYRGRTPKKTTAGIRLITAKNVKMGYLQETPAEFIAPTMYKSWMTRGIPRRGDVLFTTEAPLANVCQLNTDEKVAFAQRIIIMQPDPNRLDSTFLKYLLLSPPIQRRIREEGTGATVQGIKARLLKGVAIPFPLQLDTQREIVARLDAVSNGVTAEESIAMRKLARLEELKKSLLHEAFNGSL